MFDEKKALLLDMNSTFMFGEDRFGENEDFSFYYHSIGGKLSKDKINHIIRSTFIYLEDRYSDETYRHTFPSLEQAIENTLAVEISPQEKANIINTFAFHELGHIPAEYVDALHRLKQRFILSAVIDIWSAKDLWLDAFEKTGISKLFSAASFSSDHGMVKPSPRPFEMVVNQLKINKQHCLMIGDSVRRDLGGAMAAGIDCVLVGGADAPGAVGYYSSLLAFCNAVRS